MRPTKASLIGVLGTVLVIEATAATALAATGRLGPAAWPGLAVVGVLALAGSAWYWQRAPPDAQPEAGA
jgi:hypothetical protein